MGRGFWNLGGLDACDCRVLRLDGRLGDWATGRLGRKLGGIRLGVLVVFAAAIHQLWVQASLEARMYSMLTWLAAESTVAYLDWSRSDGGDRARGPVVRWIVICVVGFHTHLLFGGIFALQSIDILIRWARKKIPDFEVAVALGVVAILCAPMTVAWFANQYKFDPSYETEWPGTGILFRQIFRLLWGSYDSLPSYAIRGVGYAAWMVSLGGLVAFFRSGESSGGAAEGDRAMETREVRMFCLWIVLYLAGLFVGASRTNSPVLGSERYYLAIAPMLLVLGWFGIIQIYERARRIGFAVGAIALALQLCYLGAFYGGAGPGLREAIAKIEADLAEPGAPEMGLIVVTSTATQWEFGKYYGGQLPESIRFVSRDIRGSSDVEDKIRPYMEQHPRFWVLTYHEKRTGIWKLIKKKEDRFRPATERERIGETTIQRIRYHGAR